MSHPTEEAAQSSSFTPFTKAERIKQLNDIDRNITQLLHSAGLALKTLTTSQEDSSETPADRRATFESASNSYFQALQIVDVGLRRQILGLEEAEIISADKAKSKGGEDQDSHPNGKPTIGTDQAAGGVGKLDIGWLNSRSGIVGRDMEAELWQKSREFLERMESKKNNGRHDGLGDLEVEGLRGQ